ncbi:MAG: hypothetical protein ABL886_13925, partial [Rhodoglobus sp.]
MSKKIDAALKDLKKALNNHADVVGGSAVSLKKAQRANAKVAAAASTYAAAVYSKSGVGNPFSEMLEPGLESTTLASLAAERDAIAQGLTKESQSKLLAAFDTNIKRKMSELDRLDDSLRRTQAHYGLYVPGPQGEQLSEQLAKAESEVILSRTKLQT